MPVEATSEEEAMHDMVGVKEVTALLGVAKVTAIEYAKRDDFPAPVVDLPRRRLWAREDVERWARATLPLRKGRPGKEPRR